MPVVGWRMQCCSAKQANSGLEWNATLPQRPMVRIAADKKAMPAAEVKMLGYRHANAFDWGAVARAAGGRSG